MSNPNWRLARSDETTPKKRLTRASMGSKLCPEAVVHDTSSEKEPSPSSSDGSFVILDSSPEPSSNDNNVHASIASRFFQVVKRAPFQRDLHSDHGVEIIEITDFEGQRGALGDMSGNNNAMEVGSVVRVQKFPEKWQQAAGSSTSRPPSLPSNQDEHRAATSESDTSNYSSSADITLKVEERPAVQEGELPSSPKPNHEPKSEAAPIPTVPPQAMDRPAKVEDERFLRMLHKLRRAPLKPIAPTLRQATVATGGTKSRPASPSKRPGLEQANARFPLNMPRTVCPATLTKSQGSPSSKKQFKPNTLNPRAREFLSFKSAKEPALTTTDTNPTNTFNSTEEPLQPQNIVSQQYIPSTLSSLFDPASLANISLPQQTVLPPFAQSSLYLTPKFGPGALGLPTQGFPTVFLPINGSQSLPVRLPAIPGPMYQAAKQMPLFPMPQTMLPTMQNLLPLSGNSFVGSNTVHTPVVREKPPSPMKKAKGKKSVAVKPRLPNTKAQQEYEAWIEWRKANEPGYAIECKMRQQRRTQRLKSSSEDSTSAQAEAETKTDATKTDETKTDETKTDETKTDAVHAADEGEAKAPTPE